MIKIRIIKTFEGDGGSLLLVMLQEGKKYYVNVVIFVSPMLTPPKVKKRGFYKRKNAERHYQKVIEEF